MIFFITTFTWRCVCVWVYMLLIGVLRILFRSACDSAGKESACSAADLGSVPGLGRSPGEGNSYPLQNSDLENSMDCIVHGVAKSRGHDFHFTSLHFWLRLRDQASGFFFTIFFLLTGFPSSNKFHTTYHHLFWNHCFQFSACSFVPSLIILSSTF